MTIRWDSIVFAECEHGPFNYRPYRRGQNRCLECGAWKPPSKSTKQIMGMVANSLQKGIYFNRIMVKETPTKPIRIKYAST